MASRTLESQGCGIISFFPWITQNSSFNPHKCISFLCILNFKVLLNEKLQQKLKISLKMSNTFTRFAYICIHFTQIYVIITNLKFTIQPSQYISIRLILKWFISFLFILNLEVLIVFQNKNCNKICCKLHYKWVINLKDLHILVFNLYR